MTYDLIGYPEPMVTRPGGRVQILASCEQGPKPYLAELVRLICGDDTIGGPGVKEAVIPGVLGMTIQGRKQKLFIGSYGVVPAPDAVWDGAAFTFACRLFPTTPAKDAPQTIAGRFDPATGRGWRIGLTADGLLEAELGGTTLRLPRKLIEREWYRLALSFDGATARLELAALKPFPAGLVGGVVEAAAMAPDCTALPLVLAACGSVDRLDKGDAQQHYNGKIEAPCLFARAVPAAELAALVASGLPHQLAPDLVGAWDLSQDIPGSRMIDVALHSAHGALVNLPTRGVTSFDFDASVMGWPDKPAHFAAVHFHDDDFEESRWEPDFTIEIPDDLPSGVYAARLTPEGGGDIERVIFFVGAPRGKARSPIAYLASTCTYMAYANSHYGTDMAEMEPKRGTWMVIGAPEVFLNERRDFGLSPYDTHSDGSGVCYSSRRRPLFSMRVMQRLWTLNADTHITEWLDALSFDYDVITDEHIHLEGPSVLAPYRVVITGTHPEYWSTRMMDSLEAWMNAGGRIMYLGGNGFYWRTAYHPEKPWLIEVRRAESGARYWETGPGEAYHSFTGEYGGLWRRLGRPPQKLLGVGTVATGFDFSEGYYRTPEAVDPRAAFIFEGIGDEPIGNFGLVGGGAAGSEIDCADRSLGTPPHALVVATSSGNHSRYVLLTPESMTSSISNHGGEENPDVRADIVFYEGANGGAVFSTGSIAWCGSLFHNDHDNNVSRMTANVLRRFADPTPFELPSPG